MDVKKQYFDLIHERIDEMYDKQLDKIVEVANLFGKCMDNGGVVQLFGVKQGQEFVNELNYRAGGIAPFHALRMQELVMKQQCEKSALDDGSVWSDTSVARRLMGIYSLDDRDLFVVVSENGTELLALELAKIYHENGQTVIGVVNKATYDAVGGTLLDVCDMYLDMGAPYPDVAIDLEGTPVGQTDTTVAAVMAQMITAEVYKYFIEHHGSAPVLLSANVKGADVHNKSLTDPYGRRVR